MLVRGPRSARCLPGSNTFTTLKSNRLRRMTRPHRSSYSSLRRRQTRPGVQWSQLQPCHCCPRHRRSSESAVIVALLANVFAGADPVHHATGLNSSDKSDGDRRWRTWCRRYRRTAAVPSVFRAHRVVSDQCLAVHGRLTTSRWHQAGRKAVGLSALVEAGADDGHLFAATAVVSVSDLILSYGLDDAHHNRDRLGDDFHVPAILSAVPLSGSSFTHNGVPGSPRSESLLRWGSRCSTALVITIVMVSPIVCPLESGPPLATISDGPCSAGMQAEEHLNQHQLRPSPSRSNRRSFNDHSHH